MHEGLVDPNKTLSQGQTIYFLRGLDRHLKVKKARIANEPVPADPEQRLEIELVDFRDADRPTGKFMRDLQPRSVLNGAEILAVAQQLDGAAPKNPDDLDKAIDEPKFNAALAALAGGAILRNFPALALV